MSKLPRSFKKQLKTEESRRNLIQESRAIVEESAAALPDDPRIANVRSLLDQATLQSEKVTGPLPRILKPLAYREVTKTLSRATGLVIRVSDDAKNFLEAQKATKAGAQEVPHPIPPIGTPAMPEHIQMGYGQEIQPTSPVTPSIVNAPKPYSSKLSGYGPVDSDMLLLPLSSPPLTETPPAQNWRREEPEAGYSNQASASPSASMTWRSSHKHLPSDSNSFELRMSHEESERESSGRVSTSSSSLQATHDGLHRRETRPAHNWKREKPEAGPSNQAFASPSASMTWQTSHRYVPSDSNSFKSKMSYGELERGGSRPVSVSSSFLHVTHDESIHKPKRRFRRNMSTSHACEGESSDDEN